MYKVFIGGDPRFQKAFDVAMVSMLANTPCTKISIDSLDLKDLRQRGLYYRPTSVKDGLLHDDISASPMSTEFAISRFLVPHLSGFKGWSLFCDSDFLFRSDIQKVFAQADDKYAVMCVHHKYAPPEGIKMDGQAQTNYARKNWSSFMLFNNAHPMNQFLSVENVNKTTGRDLHRFCWLLDSQIGKLDESWNWLEGHSNPEIVPDAVHFTRGTPDIHGYEDVPYAQEWRDYASRQDGRACHVCGAH